MEENLVRSMAHVPYFGWFKFSPWHKNFKFFLIEKMKIMNIKFKCIELFEFSLFLEFFIGFSCVFLMIFLALVNLNPSYIYIYLLVTKSFYTLSNLILFDSLLLVYNDSLI
jgi:hypothetical protein